MKKKSILFMLINMNIGGTEKALLNMLAEMPRDRFDITVLMLEEYGGFLESIPKDVKVEYVNGYHRMKGTINNPIHKTSMELLKKGNIFKALVMLIFYFITKLTKERSLLYKYLLRDFPTIKRKFDIAVAYAGPMDFISYFVVHRVKAVKRIQWIHFDVTKIGFNSVFAKKIYEKFDKILVVSNEAKTKLVNLIPTIEEKTLTFKNIISPKIICNQATLGEGFKDRFDGVRILTVGRLSPEKGQDLAIRVLSKLLGDGLRIKWYCLGEGNSRKEYENLISDYNLTNNFILLGEDTNPYPYIKKCDIYVQPSRYEGYCITLLEAKCLNKPIVTTKVNGAEEQIKNGKTGFIVDFNEDELYDTLKLIIQNKKLRMSLSKYLNEESFESKIDIESYIS